MAIITRVSRLFKADLHAVLDRIEDPETLLRQAVRDMEEQLDNEQRRCKLLEHEQNRLTELQRELQENIRELDEKLDVCFESGQEQLTRTLIKRKLESERQDKALTAKTSNLATALASANARIQTQTARLDSMRQKAELLVNAEDAEASSVVSSWAIPAGDTPVSDEDVEVAFLREQQKRTRS
jgi:phage shock protein A